MKKFNDWELDDIEVDGIDFDDVPDFSDSFISDCLVNGEPATEEQLEIINDDTSFVYECVCEYLF